MSVLVISCGRTGTNVTVSLLSGHPFFKLDNPVENKGIFRVKKKYPNNYLAKSDVTYLDNFNQLKTLAINNPGLKFIWTIRDPRDVIMSKIRRGQPKSKGGDNQTEKVFGDATPKGAEASLRKMYENYKKCLKEFPNRTFLVKMENIIADPENSSIYICSKLNLPYDPAMKNFAKRMRNKYKIKRYGDKVDKSQIELWKNWKTVYGGFFVKNNYKMNEVFKNVEDMVKYFDYEKN